MREKIKRPSCPDYCFKIVRPILLVLICLIPVALFCNESLAEPLSRSDVMWMMQRYNKGELSEDVIKRELDAKGIDFQLSKQTLNELAGMLSPNKKSLLEFMKDSVAPLTFNGEGIEILNQEKTEDLHPDKNRYFEAAWGLPIRYQDTPDLNFSSRTFEGKDLKFRFFLQNLSTKDPVNYEDVYCEILGVNYLIQPRGGGGMPTPPTILTDLQLCRRETYKMKSQIPALVKAFLNADSCLVAKHQSGPGSMMLQAKNKQGSSVEDRRPYQVSISYSCQGEQDFVPPQIFYVRFVIPYDFGDATTRFVRSDDYFRIYWDDNLIITAFSENDFFKWVTEKEVNGFVLKNGFERTKIEKAVETLESKVDEANRKCDVSKNVFQELRALQILKSKKLVPLVEGYVRNYLTKYFPGNCKTEDECAERPEDLCTGDNWCPGEKEIGYIQTGTAIPDWYSNSYRPEYLKPGDPRLNLFQFGGGDKAAHFGMLFDVLLNANSPLLKEIADKGYRIKVLEAVMGRSGPE
jgi:hypothetical protein